MPLFNTSFASFYVGMYFPEKGVGGSNHGEENKGSRAATPVQQLPCHDKNGYAQWKSIVFLFLSSSLSSIFR